MRKYTISIVDISYKDGRIKHAPIISWKTVFNLITVTTGLPPIDDVERITSNTRSFDDNIDRIKRFSWINKPENFSTRNLAEHHANRVYLHLKNLHEEYIGNQISGIHVHGKNIWGGG